MTNQFIEPLKAFLEITRANLKWAANEIQHQYFLSTLQDIEKKYPELHTEVEAFTEHLDAIFYGISEDCPDFVEAPETYERTNIGRDFTNVNLTNLKEGDYLSNRFDNVADNSAFETEDEEYAFRFAEKMQELRQNRQALLETDPLYAHKDSEDGLNEPRYPYDTEPSA